MKHLIFSSFFVFAYCTNTKAQDSSLTEALKQHVYFLANDSLEGRATASAGEKIAYEYIIRQFGEAGVKPAGKNGTFVQPFDFVAGRSFGDNNELEINNSTNTLDKDYFPLAFSANKTITGKTVFVGYGIEAKSLKHNDYKKTNKLPGNIFIIEMSSPEGTNPHSDFYPFIDLRKKTELAISKGAIGVVFINTRDDVNAPEKQYKRNVFPVDIPVIFLEKHIWEDIKDEKEVQITLSTELLKIEKTGHNVIGFIDNNAKKTIVLGAHYDHLGWGDVGGSLYRGEPKIHNGADDNASGVALIIEVAKTLNNRSTSLNNYIFIAFSGEELGLFGSNHFVNNTNLPLEEINYMLNFDMVGRLSYTEKSLQISGVGTSSFWEVLENIQIDSIQIVTDSGGVGPSDHTSFYLKNIPVLHFFTGAHDDYHKPTDDAEFINYQGITSITNFTLALIDSLNEKGVLDFIKVKEDSSKIAPRFTVTLGIIPNYMYSEEGVKIDGVTDGKTASKAGIKTGDIVIEMGGHHVSDLMAYMYALSLFKSGDSTTVKVKRDDEVLAFDITF